MKRIDVTERAMVTYKNLNDVKAHAFSKFLSYLYENEYIELAEKGQEILKESIKEFYKESIKKESIKEFYKEFYGDE